MQCKRVIMLKVSPGKAINVFSGLETFKIQPAPVQRSNWVVHSSTKIKINKVHFISPRKNVESCCKNQKLKITRYNLGKFSSVLHPVIFSQAIYNSIQPEGVQSSTFAGKVQTPIQFSSKFNSTQNYVFFQKFLGMKNEI